MKQWNCLRALVLTMAWTWIPPLHAQTLVSKPEVWMIPPSAADGQCLRQLLTQPDQWVETRSLVQVLGYADHQLDRQFNQASAVLALARQQLKQTNRARATLSTGELMLQSQTNDL